MSFSSRRCLRQLSAQSSSVSRILHVALAGCLLASCDKAALPTQTIVAGDGFEITLRELEQVLRAAPPVRREDVAPARRALLDALIGQKLFAEEADKEKLDERPDVVQQLAATRRAILANAYLAKIGGEAETVSAGDIAKYYDDHPGLFKDRVEITVDEFALPLQDADLAVYAKLLDDRGFDALTAALARQMPDAAIVSRTLASSDVPGAMSGAAARLKPGRTISYRTAQALHLGRVAAVRPSPIAFDVARERIIPLLVEERRAALAQTAVDDLRRERHVRIVNADLSKLTAK